MLNYKSVNRNKVRQQGNFALLPKGAYVIKIVDIKIEDNKNSSGQHLKIAFDIAEGEHKDFYLKQYQGNTNEDKKWPNDAVYTLSIPNDNSPEWMTQRFFTFLANIEDSNPGYTFDGDERKLKGKLLGAAFRNEQSEYNGQVYDHIRIGWTRPADDVRTDKVTQLPKDKLVTAKPKDITGGEEFIQIPDNATEDELPF